MKLATGFNFEPLDFKGLNVGKTDSNDIVIEQGGKTIFIPAIYADQFFIQVVKLSRAKPVEGNQ